MAPAACVIGSVHSRSRRSPQADPQYSRNRNSSRRPRFLWLARCHLHLLVGRAEDRLGSALQPDVARRSLGDGARALDASDRAIRLNPADDWTVVVAMQGKCSALWVLDRYAEAGEPTGCSLGVLMIYVACF